jgi:hypothetical protein
VEKDSLKALTNPKDHPESSVALQRNMEFPGFFQMVFKSIVETGL